jgi:hypothetical protein
MNKRQPDGNTGVSGPRAPKVDSHSPAALRAAGDALAAIVLRLEALSGAGTEADEGNFWPTLDDAIAAARHWQELSG